MATRAAIAEVPQPDLAWEILVELFDALWIEDVAGFRSRSVLGAPGKDGSRDYSLTLGRGHLRAQVMPDGWRDGIRLAGMVRFETADTEERLDAATLFTLVLADIPDLAPSIACRMRDELTAILEETPMRQTTAEALEADARASTPLVWERLAAWRDRPFHPLGRSRHGFSREDTLAFGAEAGRLFALSWCALARDHVACAPDTGSIGPAALILDCPQQAMLHQEMTIRGLSTRHVAMPLHPWQAARVLPEQFDRELGDGRLVLLDFQGPVVGATSSLRTVALPSRPNVHLKLPVDVQTLGVRRLLPPQSLHNGLHGARLLSVALAHDLWLAQHVTLADETAFWHFAEGDGDLYAERQALLGCSIRSLPQKVGLILPLASLAVAPRGGLPPAIRAVAGDEPDLAKLFSGVAGLVLGVALRCACLGLVPELHGQNGLITFDGSQPRQLILRDHDTVRCAPDWLAGSGLSAPAYSITDPRSNSLLLRRAEDLIAYVQMLTVDVALRAIAEAFAAAQRGFSVLHARQILVDTTERILAEADVPDSRTAFVADLLLHNPTAPFKEVLTPLLTTFAPTTSMPSRLGRAPNPLFLDGTR